MSFDLDRLLYKVLYFYAIFYASLSVDKVKLSVRGEPNIKTKHIFPLFCLPSFMMYRKCTTNVSTISDENNPLSGTIPDSPTALKFFIKLCEQRRKFPVLYKIEFTVSFCLPHCHIHFPTKLNEMWFPILMSFNVIFPPSFFIALCISSHSSMDGKHTHH